MTSIHSSTSLRSTRRVSFDMLDESPPPRHSHRVASLVLNAQHRAYKPKRCPRTLMVVLDGHVPLVDDSPLHWLLENVATAHDHVIAIHRPPRRSSYSSWKDARPTKDAEALFEAVDDLVSTVCGDVPLRVTLEYCVGGAAHRMIQSLIRLYAPSMLVMGPCQGEIDQGISSLVSSNGRDAVKHSLEHSPVPVIVVRPETERQANKAERQNERSYADIIDMIGGVHESDMKDVSSIGGGLQPEFIQENDEEEEEDVDSLRRDSLKQSDSDGAGDDSDSGSGEFEVASGQQILAQLHNNNTNQFVSGGDLLPVDVTTGRAAVSPQAPPVYAVRSMLLIS